MSILDTITPEGVKKITSGFESLVDAVNPMTTVVATNKNREILDLLVKSGYTFQQIMDIVDIGRVSAEPYVNEQIMRQEIRLEILAESEEKTEETK